MTPSQHNTRGCAVGSSLIFLSRFSDEVQTRRIFCFSSFHTRCFGGQIEEYEMGGDCSKHGEMRNAYKMLVGKLEGKRSLGRPRVGPVAGSYGYGNEPSCSVKGENFLTS
jgi:hypothetical protein